MLSGEAYRSYIWGPEDEDWYYIEIKALDTIEVDLDVPGEDYDLYLYDSGVNIVAQSANYGGVDEHISYEPSYVGRYYIRVYPYEGVYSRTGIYILTASFK